MLWKPPPAIVAPLHGRVGLVAGEGKLVQELDPQPRVDQRAYYITQAVLPLVGRGLDYPLARIARVAALEEQFVVGVPVCR